MSHENVELLKHGLAAFNRGDIAGMLAMMDPELEFVTAGLIPGISPVYRGHDGWVTFWRDFRETWESFSIETNEFRDAGDRVAQLMTIHVRGRNGLEMHRKFAGVWTVRDGLAVRIQGYGEWSAALEAVGLPD
jgi:ketosteroid isomerase-like protein